MEENNDINKLSPSDVQKLKMNPPENAWTRLDAELARKQALVDKQKASRYKFLFIITGLLLLCSIGYLYFATTSKKKIAITENKIAAQATNNKLNVNSAPTLSNIQQEKEMTTAPANTTSSNSLNDKTSQKNTNSTTVNNTVSSNKSKTHSTALVSNKIIGKATAATDSSQTKIDDSKPVTGRANDASMSKGNINPGVSNSAATADAKNNNQTSQSSVSSSTPTTSSSTKTIPAKTNTGVVDPDIAGGVNINDKRPIHADSIKPVETPPAEVANKTTLNNNTGNTLNNKPSGNNNILHRFSISAAFSSDYTRNHLKEVGQNSYYESYNERESVNYSATTGLLLRFDLTNHWSVASGATYSTIAYSVTLPDIYAYYNNNWQLHYLYPTACGLVELPNSNATTATHVGETINTPTGCSQVVKFINLPVIARYQLNLNKFNVYANVGVEFNFTMQERAKVTINNTETTVVNNIDGLRSTNYGMLSGIGGQYNINKGIGIFMEIDYRRSITSLTENIPIDCYPYSFGLNTGLTFHF